MKNTNLKILWGFTTWKTIRTGEKHVLIQKAL